MILHLSDTHLPRATGPDADGVDAREVLRRLLADCRHLVGVDLVVVSGDVADDGSVEAYRDARTAIVTWAAERGAATVFAVGNHDERTTFAEVLGTGHRDRDDRDAGELLVPGLGRAAVSVVAGRRVISLDSLVPGQTYGVVTDDQLAALSRVLAQPAPRGSVVVLHHPPIAPAHGVLPTVGLRNAADLAAAVHGSDVALILCGHFHLQLSGQLDGVPVWVTPGVVSRLDLTTAPHLERAVQGASATLIDLDGPAAPLCHVLHSRDPQTGRQLYLVDAVGGEDALED